MTTPAENALVTFDDIAKLPLVEQLAQVEKGRENAIDGLPEPVAIREVIRLTGIVRMLRAQVRAQETSTP